MTTISRSEALRMARETLERAEQERTQQACSQWFAAAAHTAGRIVVFGADGDEVCTVCGNLAEDETAEERARLIAATPKLLAEIEHTLDVFREADLWDRTRIVREIIDMIARYELLVETATGEMPE